MKNGLFVGYQTTRDQAAWIGESASRGTSYAEDHKTVAFQRMPNVSLAADAKSARSLADIIAATDDGVLVSGNGSWSIDHQRYNFQFSGQMFHEVKNGQDHGPAPRRRVPVELARVLEFLRHARRPEELGDVRHALGREGRAGASERGEPRLPAGALPRDRHPQRERTRQDVSAPETRIWTTSRESVLAVASDLAKGAEVRVDVDRTRSANVRFAKNEMTTSGEYDEVTVAVSVALGKRQAWTSTNQTDAASLKSLVERAVAMARLAPEDPETMPLLPPQTYARGAARARREARRDGARRSRGHRHARHRRGRSRKGADCRLLLSQRLRARRPVVDRARRGASRDARRSTR